MSNIRVDVNFRLFDGAQVSFKSPANFADITGLRVYYPESAQVTASKDFIFADAHGVDVSNLDELFGEGAIVKVLLDTTNSRAFVQNADTNSYLESRFSSIENSIPTQPATQEKAGLMSSSDKSILDKLYYMFIFKGTEGLSYSLKDDSTYECTGVGTATDTDIVIPYYYENLPVTSIANEAFRRKPSITSVIVTGGITTIGDYAFYDCGSLTSVAIAEGVESIGTRAFNNCTSLTTIEISDSVTKIGDSAFSGCTSLTSVEIPDSVETIGKDAFYGTAYYNDESNWENDVLYIGNHLISVKTTLSGDYTIKTGTKCIADYAFYKRSSLTGVTIPDSVTSIGAWAFRECYGLTSIVIPEGVTAINPYTFYACTKLAEVSVPDIVTTIGEFAFYRCWAFTSITIPESVKEISRYAFAGCQHAESIIIPESVTTIVDYAFDECFELNAVYYKGTEEQWSAIAMGSSGNDYLKNATITYNYTES